MKYRLGLDLGVGSIGSAVIELDNENNAKKFPKIIITAKYTVLSSRIR